MGHSGPDDYCYCDSVDAKVHWVCETPRLNSKGKCIGRCHQRPMIITGLTDQYAMDRWFKEHIALLPEGI